MIHRKLREHDVSPSAYVSELPLHKEPVFPEDNDLSLPKTEFLCSRHMALPIFYSMTDEQALYVAKTLKAIVTQRTD